MYEKVEKLYEGKAKILYISTSRNKYIQYFKDDATAFNGGKKGVLEDKGILNNRISTIIFNYLEKWDIATHFVSYLSDREMVVEKVIIFPIEVVVRNVVAGSLAKKFGLTEGSELSCPVLEHYLKNDELGDPMINYSHIKEFGLATTDQINFIDFTALAVNKLLKHLFKEIGILLVDFKLEFGLDKNDKILLADEISPDGCRLWDMKSGEKMDKDRFRQDLGNITESYREVYKRFRDYLGQCLPEYP